MAEAQAAVKVASTMRRGLNRDEGWTVELTPWREARFGGMRRPLTMVQLGVGVMLLLCVRAVLMRARTVWASGPLFRRTTEADQASCSPKACCSRSAAVRSAPPSWRGIPGAP